MVPRDTNGWFDVFVHDRKTGTTERVSVDSAGNQGNYDSDEPAISADGRFVAFASEADNLVPGDTNGTASAPWPYVFAGVDIFVHDHKTGVAETDGADLAGE